MIETGHGQSILSEFTHQARAFNVSPVMRSAATLRGLIEFMPLAPDQSWVDLAAGPGLVSRALAPHVASVHAIDLTAAMVELGRAEAAREGVTNVTFSLGDACALDVPAGSFDGAVTRFSLHHIPFPERCIAEMARVVRPGGYVVIGDHVGSEDRAQSLWHESIERLRDPSHWACLPHGQIRALALALGLLPVREKVVPFWLDFEEWLTRGSGAAQSRDLIEEAIRRQPAGVSGFHLSGDRAAREIGLLYSVSVWRTR